MKSAMKRAAGGVALTMVLIIIRGFCGGGVFLGYLGIECLVSSIKRQYEYLTLTLRQYEY